MGGNKRHHLNDFIVLIAPLLLGISVLLLVNILSRAQGVPTLLEFDDVLFQVLDPDF